MRPFMRTLMRKVQLRVKAQARDVKVTERRVRPLLSRATADGGEE